jgi:tRNA(Ile)-lysidine synthase
MHRPAPSLRLPARRDRTVAAIARRWRELTSGRRSSGRLGAGERTLVACSGGADSSALVLALAAITKDLMIAHVVHDLRPEAESLADRDAVRSLATPLALPFVESRISTRHLLIDGAPAPAGLVNRAGDRNLEGLARNLRYLALAKLAQAHSIQYIATAHHAGDQFESMLMALVRGSGPRGLRGTAPSRRFRVGDATLRIIRPMLGVTRDECERLCRDAGWPWREDPTNADTARLRSYLRHRVIPEILAARPGADVRAGASAELLRDAAALLSERVKALLASAERTSHRDGVDELSWPRSALRRERPAVLGELIRRAARRLTDERGLDKLGRSALDAVIDAIRSPARHPRRFELRKIEVHATSRIVTIRAREKTTSN